MDLDDCPVTLLLELDRANRGSARCLHASLGARADSRAEDLQPRWRTGTRGDAELCIANERDHDAVATILLLQMNRLDLCSTGSR